MEHLLRNRRQPCGGRIRKSVHFILGALFAALVSPIAGYAADGMDHLECYRVKDGIGGSYGATLDLAGAGFPDASGCRIKLRAKQICRPASRTLVETEVLPGPIEGDPDAFFKICYRAKCEKSTVSAETFTDAFGTREFTKWKSKLVCVPAVRGALYDVTFRLNDSTNILGVGIEVDYGAATGDFEGDSTSVSCEAVSGTIDALAFRDNDSTRRLDVMLIEGDGLTGPLDLLRCRFASTGGAPSPSDFFISTDGVDMNGSPVIPEVIVSSISAAQ